MNTAIDPEVLSFISSLKQNNNKAWFTENKNTFNKLRKSTQAVLEQLKELMNQHDNIDAYKFFRIYKDVRFSKDKLPYKTNFGCSFQRATSALRGGYYVHIEPEASFLAIGFWMPEKDDLKRIRQEIDIDATELNNSIQLPSFKNVWGELQGETLKSSPRDYDKDHPEIELLKRKSFVFMKPLSDGEVLSNNFIHEVNTSFKAARPFLDVMSEILTTDLNGLSLID